MGNKSKRQQDLIPSSTSDTEDENDVSELVKEISLTDVSNNTTELPDLKRCRHLRSINISYIRIHSKEIENLARFGCDYMASSGNPCRPDNDKPEDLSKLLYICLKCLRIHCQYHLLKHSHDCYPLHCKYSPVKEIWCQHCHRLISQEIDRPPKNLDEIHKLLYFSAQSLESKSLRHGVALENEGQSLDDADRVHSHLDQSLLYIPLTGFPNLGNTCFFNSALQALLHTQPLCSYISKHDLFTSNHDSTEQFLWKDLFFMFKSIYDGQSGIPTGSSKSVGITSVSKLFEQVSRRWPIYRKMRQQDSHEFLRRILEEVDKEHLKNIQLSDSLNTVESDKKQPLMEKIFGGKWLSKIKCGNCGYISEIVEPFMDISLPIPKLQHSDITIGKLLADYMQTDNLDNIACFDCEKCSRDANIQGTGDIHINPEGSYGNHQEIESDSSDGRLTTIAEDSGIQLSRNEASFESSGNDDHDYERSKGSVSLSNMKVIYRCAEKSFIIVHFPEILVLHLNRFFSSGVSRSRKYSKSHQKVIYTPILKFPNHDVKYSLYATIVHSGSTMDSGHYIAYVKQAKRKVEYSIDDLHNYNASSPSETRKDLQDQYSWYCCSDTSVRETSLEEVFSGNAYLLFYQRL